MLTKNGKSNINAVHGTVIGSGVTLTGKLEDKGPITIYGKAEGEIVSNENIIVGETAQVRGPISARQVTVAGQTVGEIVAEDNLHITTTGIVEGKVVTNKLAVEPGAILIGECDMQQAKVDRAKAEHEAPVEPKPSKEKSKAATKADSEEEMPNFDEFYAPEE